LIGKGKCRLGPERREGITGMPLPETIRELQKFLGLIGYYRLWIESYAFSTKTLYSKLLEEEPDPLYWEPEEVQIIESLKQFLIIDPVLALPCLEKSFHLSAKVYKGTALGVLTQEHGEKKQPLVYFSKFLDPVTQGWPECI
jgi:hypothetical protein